MSHTENETSRAPSHHTVGAFGRLGGWCYRRRWSVLGLWVLFVVVAGSIIGAIGTEKETEFSLPDVESREGDDIFEEHFDGRGAGTRAPLVFVADDGVDDASVQATMQSLFTSIEAIDGITVVSPYADEGAGQVAVRGEQAGRLAYAQLEISPDVSFEDTEAIGDEIRELLPDEGEGAGLQVELGGEVFYEWEDPTSELIGLAFAIVILIVAFGSVIAMGLPIGVAFAGIGAGTIMAGFMSHVFEVPDWAEMLGMMIGMGVGIDYALFIVTRFRENRRSGMSIEQSITVAINTAGRAVIFAGLAVVTSLLGMVLMQLSFITGMAVAVSTVVVVTMVASVTLLPAIVGIVGDRIEITRWRAVVAAGLVSVTMLGLAFNIEPFMLGLPLAAVVMIAGLFVRPLKQVVPPRRHKSPEQTFWYRWSRLVQRNPWPVALGGAALLVVLALPVAGMRLGFADESNYPTGTGTRDAYDLLADGFGPGFNGPLLLAAELPDGGVDQDDLDTVTASLARADGVEHVDEPTLNDLDAPDAVAWNVVPATSPQDQATTDLVEELRGDVLPAATEGTGLDVVVSGAVAANNDFADYIGKRLAYLFGAVLALSFVLLMVVFRSILVPLKAVMMNLLGIGAAFGVLVAIFQWGWFGSTLGIDAGPIEPFMPMMLFAMVFGLSMDYEVFLLSRIKEGYDRTGDSHTSVANGLAVTARVITAAAAIMVAVFGAFALGDERVLMMSGLGLALAVALDATVVRLLLVPATMELLGDRNWWFPAWLDRLLPTIDVEGHGRPEESAPDDEDPDPSPDRQRQRQPA